MADTKYNTKKDHVEEKEAVQMTKKETVIMYSLALATFAIIILGSIEVLVRG